MTHNPNSRHFRVPPMKLSTASSPHSSRLTAHVTVHCHGCGGEMEILSEPAQIWLGHTYILCYPCLEAPYICESCRQDPVRLDKARVAMDRHFAECSGGRDPQVLRESTGGAAA